MRMRYIFKESAVLAGINNAGTANAQAIGEALEQIPDRTPERVHDEVRKGGKRHPLYQHLEWNDAKGAYDNRLRQIRQLMRIVRIVEDDETADEAKPAFVSVVAADGNRKYLSYNEILASRDMQIRVMKQAERDLSAFQHRYRELADICSEIDTIRERVAQRRRNLETPAPPP